MRLFWGLIAILSLFGCQGYPNSGVSAELSGYRLEAGERWSGVKIGREAPRGTSLVCWQNQCYPLPDLINLPQRLVRAYGVQDVSFDALAGALGVLRQSDEQLLLPGDLGAYLFDQARAAYQLQLRPFFPDRTRGF